MSTPSGTNCIRSIGLFIVVVGFACLSPGSTLGASGGAEEAIREVQIDFPGPAITEFLPFDEPFVMKGEVPTSLHPQKIELWWKQSEMQPHLTCGDLDSSGLAAADWMGPSVFWFGRWAVEGDSAQLFRCMIDPLAGNKMYQFVMVLYSDGARGDSSAQQARAQQAVAVTLQRLADAGKYDPTKVEWTNAGYNSLIDSLNDLARAIVAPNKPPIPGECGPGLDARVPMGTASKYIVAELDRNQFVKAYHVSIGDADSVLQVVFADKQVAQTLARLLQDKNKLTALSAEASASIGKLAFLTDGEVRKSIASGVISLDQSDAPLTSAVSVDVKKVSTSSQLKPLGDNLTKTREYLLELAVIAESAAGNTTGARTTALNDAADGLRDAEFILSFVSGDLDNLMKSLEKRQAAITQVSVEVVKSVRRGFPLLGNTGAGFVEMAMRPIIPDFGIAFVPGLDEVAPYFGINFHLRPVNKRVPVGPWYRADDCRRWAILMGITVHSVAKQGRREDLFGSNDFLLGASYRLTDAARITVGSLFFKSLDPNPVIDKTSIDASPFVSLSLDLKLKELFDTVIKPIF